MNDPYACPTANLPPLLACPPSTSTSTPERAMVVETRQGMTIEGLADTIAWSQVSEVVIFKHQYPEPFTVIDDNADFLPTKTKHVCPLKRGFNAIVDVNGRARRELPAQFIVKIYHKEKDIEEYIENEIRVLESLKEGQGQYFPTFYGEVAVSGHRALAMEHVHGTTLAERISERRQSDADWLYSLGEEVRGLLMKPSEYAHVVHGDGETRNIIVEEQPCGRPRLRLIDFSHSRFCDEQRECWCTASSRNRELYRCTEQCKTMCHCGESCPCQMCECQRSNAADADFIIRELFRATRAAVQDGA